MRSGGFLSWATAVALPPPPTGPAISTKDVCLHHRKKFKVICLNDSISIVLAYANDLSYEDIFVEQLKNFFIEGDVVIGISGSGNSKNILNAINYANANGGTTVGLCGFSGGRLYSLVHVPILAKVEDMQKVEDIHMIVAHITMQRLKEELKGLEKAEEQKARLQVVNINDGVQ
jgi:D-sedoheptulose 7-phosphate isomerase